MTLPCASRYKIESGIGWSALCALSSSVFLSHRIQMASRSRLSGRASAQAAPAAACDEDIEASIEAAVNFFERRGKSAQPAKKLAPPGVASAPPSHSKAAEPPTSMLNSARTVDIRQSVQSNSSMSTTLSADTDESHPDDVSRKIAALRRHTTPSLLYCSIEEFMHGPITREEAEQRLRAAGFRSGLFLVREKSVDESYVISVVEQGRVNHYLMERRNKNGEHFYVICSHGFPDHETAEDLVNYLMVITQRFDDLPVLSHVCESTSFQ